MTAFNGDKIVQQEILRIIDRFKIHRVVETGAYEGDTTEFLADLVEQVYTIEAMPEHFHFCRGRFRNRKNIVLIGGDSRSVFPQLLEGLPRMEPLLIYLDAHRFNESPLLMELQAIGTAGFEKAIIVIDDFKVPGRNLRFDFYGDIDNGLPYVAEQLAALPGGAFYYFNDHSDVMDPGRGGTGKIYIFPYALRDLLADWVIQDGEYFYSNLKNAAFSAIGLTLGPAVPQC